MVAVFVHGLRTLLSIFLFLICLFIRLICKWFKIAWFAFWLNINETQPSKYIAKNRNPIVLDSALFFEFPLPLRVWNKIYKMYCLYMICFIFHSLWSFNWIFSWILKVYTWYQNGSWKRLGGMWLVWLISASGPLFSLKGRGVLQLFLVL